MSMFKRLTDRLETERKFALDNLMFAVALPMSIECIRDLSDYHGELAMQYQSALRIRLEYAQKKRFTDKVGIGLEDNYLR